LAQLQHRTDDAHEVSTASSTSFLHVKQEQSQQPINFNKKKLNLEAGWMRHIEDPL
jgi:hypothetical protein